MPIEIEPAELARLLDFAERPRAGGWSLRAALVRYAQPEPERVGQIVELVRRIEWALRRDANVFEQDGRSVWASMTETPSAPTGPHRQTVGLLHAAAELDQLGDHLASWAVLGGGHRPDDDVDDVVASVTGRLDALGVPYEDPERARPRRG